MATRPPLSSFVGTTTPTTRPPLSSFVKQEPQPLVTDPESKFVAGIKKVGGFLSGIGKAVISAETAVGNDLTAGTRAGMETKNEDMLRGAQDESEKVLSQLIAKQKAEGRDSSRTEKILATARQNSIAPQVGDFQKSVPESTKTNLQGLGDVAGVGLDVLSAGTYGSGFKSFNLASKTLPKVVAPVVEKTLGQTLKGVVKETGKKTLVGAGSGYAYDVARNLQEGKTGSDIAKPGMGTILGGTVPVAIGGIKVGMAVSKNAAPRFINSLIKPKQADFSYGKNPGRTVSELGITGNDIDDFGKNIGTQRQEVGSKIGSVYARPENADIVLDVTEEINKIDEAMKVAAKGGKNNQGIVTQLQNVKDALMFEHAIDADGNIVRVGKGVVNDFSNINAKDVFALKQRVADATQFTGRPSDDKIVNATLKKIYGGLKTKLNGAVGKNNPEIIKLNEQYADLVSAELATKNRAAIIGRADLVGLKVGGAGALGTTAALLAGTATLPAVLVGIAVGALEKGLETTAVKSRVAAWLGSASPSVIRRVIESNPAIKSVLYRLLPKLSSRIGD